MYSVKKKNCELFVVFILLPQWSFDVFVETGAFFNGCLGYKGLVLSRFCVTNRFSLFLDLSLFCPSVLSSVLFLNPLIAMIKKGKTFFFSVTSKTRLLSFFITNRFFKTQGFLFHVSCVWNVHCPACSHFIEIDF